MTSKTIGAAIQRLRDAYPRESLSDSSIRVYAEDLADLRDDAVYDAIVRLTRKEIRRPTIAQIRREVAEEALALPDIDGAWDLANRGTSGGIPEVAATIGACGGVWSIKHSENPTTLRAQFERDYTRRRDAALANYSGALPALPPPPSIHRAKVEQIPETTRIRPRPIMWRLATRYAGQIVQPLEAMPDDAREALMRDALGILHDGPIVDGDPTWVEAHRVLDEASR